MYKIESKTDFSSGIVLTITMPIEEADKKALYTILNDKPDFILPFNHKVVDGQIELSYTVGNRSKIAYISGTRNTSDYADLWFSIFNPLAECGDWFLNPFSFVFDPEYLYYDKSSKKVSYVYIPSMHKVSDGDDLRRMVKKIIDKNPVTDLNLENMVLRAMQEFNPSAFMQMIKNYRISPESEVAASYEQPLFSPIVQAQKPTAVMPSAYESPVVSNVPMPQVQRSPDDISINLDAQPVEKKKKGGFFGFGGSKEPKEPKEKKEKPPKEKKPGFFSRKKNEPKEIVGGAAVMPMRQAQAHIPYTPPNESYINDNATQLDEFITGATRLRYVGNAGHPSAINVNITQGDVFTIGRFDATIGVKQSNFEFDRKTKAVSRRHAAIELRQDGYYLVDLDSSGKTFVNGHKIPPNVPFKLERGFRVSFGHLGADYAWEE